MTAVSRMLTTKYMGKRQKDLEGSDWRVDPRIPGPALYKAPRRLDAGRTSGVRGRWGTSQPAKQGSSRGGPREPGGCTAPRAAMQCVLLLPIPRWRLVEALGVCRWGSKDFIGASSLPGFAQPAYGRNSNQGRKSSVSFLPHSGIGELSSARRSE